MSGPQFLLLFIGLMLAANIWLRWRIRAGEVRPRISVRFAQDPLRIAALRDGPDAAIKLAIFSLIDRGLLQEFDGLLGTAGELTGHARRPLEQAILDCCVTNSTVNAVFLDAQVNRAARDYQQELLGLGLLPDTECIARRTRLAGFAIGTLVVVAGLRLANAFIQGRSNVWFLIILTVIAVFTLRAPIAKRLTAYGTDTLAHLEKLFERLHSQPWRIKAGGASTDAVLLAAVFGLHALPATVFPFCDRLFPRPPPSSSSSDSGSSGSDSGGGGGCGGGGCGGGCGG